MPTPMEDLSSHIISRTREVWDGSMEPYYLSQITPETRLKGLDYREIIGPITLKEFVISSLADEVTLITHPFQKAKIGLIPKGESFTFETQNGLQSRALEKTADKPAKQYHPKYAVMNFLQALSKLDDDELDKINIPVSVFARMFQDR